MAGVFPEIKRAWYSVGRTLYLWNYETGQDYIMYSQADSQTIQCVALAPVRPNVLVADIRHVLLVASASDVEFLPVSWRPNGDLLLLHVDQAAPIAGGVAMAKAACTSGGRVFFAGGDGNVHEFFYSTSRGLMSGLLTGSPKCRVGVRCVTGGYLKSIAERLWSGTEPLVDIAVDEGRRALYTLSESSTLSVYDLGADPHAALGPVRHIASVAEPWVSARQLCPELREWGCRGESAPSDSEITVLYEAFCREQPQDQGLRLQRTAQQKWDVLVQRGRVSDRFLSSIAVVPQGEADLATLVAVTSRGARLYFSACEDCAQLSVSPTRLVLRHVRLPPNYSYGVSAPAHAPFYSNGLFLYATGSSDARDTVTAVAPDLSREMCNSTFKEKTNQSACEGRVISFVEDVPAPVVEAPQAQPKPMAPQAGATAASVFLQSPARPSAGASQLSESLSSTVPSQAPVGSSVLSSWNELAVQHAQPARRVLCLSTAGVRAFVKQRAIDALVSLLQANSDQDIQRFFDRYSHDEACAMCLALCCSSEPGIISLMQTSNLAVSASRAFIKFGGQPRAAQGIVNMDVSLARDMNLEVPDVTYSSMHNGLTLHLSRVLRPLWTATVVRTLPRNRHRPPYIDLVWRPEQLNAIEYILRQTIVFLEQNVGMRFLRPASASSGSQQQNMMIVQQPQEDAVQKEQRSFAGLVMLARQSAEVLALLQFLARGGAFNTTAQRLPATDQLQLQQMAFWEFIATPEGHSLRRALISARMIGIATSDSGRSIDADSRELAQLCPSLYTENEHKHFKGRELITRARASVSQESRAALLSESLEALRCVLGVGVAEICSLYRELEYPEGVVTLALAQARLADPNGTSTDPSVIERVGDCHQAVLSMFGTLINNVPSGVSLSQMAAGIMAVPDAAVIREQLYRLVRMSLEFPDRRWHFALYTWMMGNGLTGEMLKLETKFIQDFLSAPERADELLWRWYEQRGDLCKAAFTLLTIVERKDPNYDLSQNIEKLTQAKALLSRVGHGDTDSQAMRLAPTIDNYLDVAIVQVHVLDELKALPQTQQTAQAIDSLSRSVVSLQELFNISRAFMLSECVLKVLHCGRCPDEKFVMDTWQQIIDAEMRQGDVRSLKAKFEILSREFGRDSSVYPIRFLVQRLENVNFAHNRAGDLLAFDWVPHTMAMDAEVQFTVLFDEYDTLQQQFGGEATEYKAHVLKVLGCITRSWMTEVQVRQEPGAVRAIKGRALPKVRALKNSLIGSTNELYSELSGNYTNLVECLEKLF